MIMKAGMIKMAVVSNVLSGHSDKSDYDYCDDDQNDNHTSLPDIAEHRWCRTEKWAALRHGVGTDQDHHCQDRVHNCHDDFQDHHCHNQYCHDYCHRHDYRLDQRYLWVAARRRHRWRSRSLSLSWVLLSSLHSVPSLLSVSLSCIQEAWSSYLNIPIIDTGQMWPEWELWSSLFSKPR